MEHNQGQFNAYRESCTAASAVTCKLKEWGRENGGVGHLCGVAVRYYVGVVMVRKKKRKKREGHGREAGNGKKTSRHRISCTHGRYINKQHAKTSAVHILATRLKLHQTVFFFFFFFFKDGHSC
jgi:hypothetical protein